MFKGKNKGKKMGSKKMGSGRLLYSIASGGFSLTDIMCKLGLSHVRSMSFIIKSDTNAQQAQHRSLYNFSGDKTYMIKHAT